MYISVPYAHRTHPVYTLQYNTFVADKMVLWSMELPVTECVLGSV
uniref:Uncharacterized protein n=1 Tax=Anguilla anguilla TaxID=7936 RepID=A0A0E9P6Z5_ANGAN